MKRLFLGGLAVLLSCLTAHVHAQEIQWRSARTRNSIPSRMTPPTAAPWPAANQNRSPIALSRPIVVRSSNPDNVVPAAYARQVSNQARPLPLAYDSKESIEPLPLRAGEQPIVNNPEGIPLPTPLPGDSTSLPAPDAPPQLNGAVTEPVWSNPGGPVIGHGGSPYAGGHYYQNGSEVGPGPGPGPVCVDGDDCGAGYCGECFGDWACGSNGCGLPRLWFQAEYLLWGIKEDNLPPLVTQTNLSAAQINNLDNPPGIFPPGALGQPSTNVLFGGGVNDDSETFSGGRFTIGFRFPCKQWAFETTYFFLGEQTRNFATGSNGQPGIYRPLVDTRLNIESSEIVAIPDGVNRIPGTAGYVSVENQSRLWGLEFNFRKSIMCDCNSKFDLLLGARYAELVESVSIFENVAFIRDRQIDTNGDDIIDRMVFANDRIQVLDQFRTRNRFYGGQIGLDYEHRLGRWIFGVNGKLALGNMHQTVNIDGMTTFLPTTGIVATDASGLYAQPSNIGRYARDQFTVVPELGLKVGFQVTNHFSLYAGYNLLYLSNVVRPGDQITREVDPAQLPGVNRNTGQIVRPSDALPLQPARPVFVFRSTDFWAQGFNVGLKLEY